jgi:hypothetical protein
MLHANAKKCSDLALGFQFVQFLQITREVKVVVGVVVGTSCGLR